MALRHSHSYRPQKQQALLLAMSRGYAIDDRYTDSLCRPFRRDFSDFISLSLGQEKSFRAELPGLDIYLLRGNLEIPCHDRGECAVLENKKTGAHVVLHGERCKANFQYQRGICAFLTGAQDPVKEVRILFSLWEKGIEPFKIRYDENRHALAAAMKELFTETDFAAAYDTFLAPVYGPRVPAKNASDPSRAAPARSPE